MLRMLEPQKEAENKNAEADFRNPCSYKMKSVYQVLLGGAMRLGFTEQETTRDKWGFLEHGKFGKNAQPQFIKLCS